jgi:hypothetical protein
MAQDGFEREVPDGWGTAQFGGEYRSGGSGQTLNYTSNGSGAGVTANVTNVTNELTSIVISFDGGLTFQRVALFSGGLQGFFWQYANKGLRLLQLRFYQQ